jgi:hypothetical protein
MHYDISASEIGTQSATPDLLEERALTKRTAYAIKGKATIHIGKGYASFLERFGE